MSLAATMILYESQMSTFNPSSSSLLCRVQIQQQHLQLQCCTWMHHSYLSAGGAGHVNSHKPLPTVFCLLLLKLAPTRTGKRGLMNGHTGTEKVNGMLHLDREGKCLVILGQRGKWTGHTGTERINDWSHWDREDK